VNIRPNAEPLRSSKTTEPGDSRQLPSASVSLDSWSLALPTLPSAFVELWNDAASPHRGPQQLRTLATTHLAYCHEFAQAVEKKQVAQQEAECSKFRCRPC
jgi:hypothetical protein